ncbi:hypothetical protein ACFLWA_03275 [Chloroflexota bacterium]
MIRSTYLTRRLFMVVGVLVAGSLLLVAATGVAQEGEAQEGGVGSSQEPALAPAPGQTNEPADLRE